MKYLGIVLIALAGAFSVAAQDSGQNGQAAQTDRFAGTWKLNVAKSKFNPGPPAKGETVTIAPDKVTVEEVTADGTTQNWSYTPSPGVTATITGMENSSVMEKKVNDHTMEDTWKMGNATMQGKGVLSKDGKKMTYTLTGTNEEGKPLHNVLVLEKQ
jgi:hypothetical protein